MSENKKSIVEEALLSMKNLEEIISENAKGILASTMKEEISELVKESLSGSRRKRSLHEQEGMPMDQEPSGEVPAEEEDEFVDTEVDTEVETEVDAEMPMDQGMEPSVDANKPELPPLDMTQSPMSDIIKVFKLMGDEDGIIVKKDEKGDIHIKDDENEYMIVMDDENMTQQMNEEEIGSGSGKFSELMNNKFDELKDRFRKREPKSDMTEFENFEEYGHENFEDMDMVDMHREENVYEVNQEDLESVLEAFKYSKKPNMDGGFDDKKKEGSKRFGKGGVAKNAKIYPSKKELRHGVYEMQDEEKESEWTEDMDSDLVYQEDTKYPEKTEAARTYGNGSKSGRGLRKAITPNRDYVYGKNGVQKESVNRELNTLREKNEEYKKALDFFRNKLNEVAVFNSNLAYSTRLFTEHSTTKQEKINILRRFDDIETLKESKNLYKSIKNELDGGSDKVVKESIKESVQRTVSRVPQTGSASNLI